jgi:hypothetical protein
MSTTPLPSSAGSCGQSSDSADNLRTHICSYTGCPVTVIHYQGEHPDCWLKKPEQVSTQAAAPDFGEPWQPAYSKGIQDRFASWRGVANSGQERDRIIACVNALEGIADPAAYLAKLREENAAMRAGITEAYKIIDVLYMDALDNHKESWPRAREWMEQWKEVAK